jgi:TadE-like protein
MRSVKLAGKLLRDTTGSVLVESTLVIPLFFLLALGTVDVAYMLFDWALANKAAYVGARTAVVSDPVASTIPNIAYTPTQLQNLGQPCFDGSGNNINCPSASSVCTSGGCTNSFGYDDLAFAAVLTAMKNVFPRLAAANLQIRYQTNGAGFVGQPNSGNPAQFSLPMDVTVSITGMTHQFYFIGPILSFFGGTIAATPAIPAFASTMQSEDMTTN